MAKVNKLALVRLALRETFKELDKRERLCVLADMYCKADDAPRWFGGGEGTRGLEQGIYSSMTTFRRVSALWSKVVQLGVDPKVETVFLRDLLMSKLDDDFADQIAEKPEPGGE